MSGEKIIIVDDEAEMRDRLRDVLEEQNYWVRTVGDGPQAIEQAKKDEFNLALIDLMLPGMGGLELMREMSRISPKLLVIFLTGFASLETAIEAIRQGAYDYITKPFEPSALVTTIERGLEKQRLSGENEKLLESLKEKTQKLEELYLGSLTALAATIDARNFHTLRHSEQVTKYSLEVAKGLDLSEGETEKLEQAGRLHDIGKIAIPDSILGKPGKLTEDEWEVVKKHPVRGANILNSSGFLHDIVPVVRHHHERYDGSGYPDGLSGKAIPLGSRIIAVSDAFEAMTADRPYRRAFQSEKALEEIRLNAGTQFDPEIEEVFINTWQGRV